jgi:hypothetical protein
VGALARAVAESSRQKVAYRLGYSRSAVSTALRNCYPAEISAFAERVKAVLLAVQCPILGEIAGQTCEHHRTRPFTARSHLDARLFNACRTCPNNPDARE